MRKEIFENEREVLNILELIDSIPSNDNYKIIKHIEEEGLIKKPSIKSAEEDYYKFLDSFDNNDSIKPEETSAHKYIKELEKEINACDALNNTEKYINNIGRDEKKTSETQD